MRKQTFVRTLLVILVLVAAGLACNRPSAITAQPTPVEPMSEEEMQRLQDQMAATLASTSGGVSITLTQEQINSIIIAKLAEQPEQILTEPAVVFTQGNMEVTGKISQAGLSLNMKMVLTPIMNANGEPDFDVKEMSLGGIPVPDELKKQVSNLISQALREYLANQTEGFQVTGITVEEGQMTITGNVP